MRVGIGYDIHGLKAGRRFVLGGIEVPFGKGPSGHSDGDVLYHAIVDAVLGAAGAGDIGEHFPDTDPRYKSVDSALFVRETLKILKKRGLRVLHIDSTVITEKPKLATFKENIRRNVAKEFGLPVSAVGFKAKTNEGFGPVGQNKAVACFAVASVGPSGRKRSP